MQQLATRLASVRARTEALVAGLNAEDCQLQSMPDASPVKWHLAHTTWFFDTFALPETCSPPAYRRLYNSYYLGVGPCHRRSERGLISRPTLAEVLEYRRQTESRLAELLARAAPPQALREVLELGLQHEQQHQELILTDVKHHFWCNPLRPAYREQATASESGSSAPLRFLPQPGGHVEIGHGGDGFCFDNEMPRHRRWLEPFALADRLVSNGEYLDFIDAGGYRRPELWLSDGWDLRLREAWDSPLYWERDGAGWTLFTLAGPSRLRPHEPVSHVSYYEADAYARWAGARLCREDEWETAASKAWHSPTGQLRQMFGDLWQWTASAYLPYPGFRPLPGAVGEYNGKFMVNQMVLRGGSCATPAEHLRPSYRNFFPPAARWQFSGIRLAQDIM